MRSASLAKLAPPFVLGCLVACGGSPRPPASTTAKAKPEATVDAAPCNGDPFDPTALFAAHAAAFGTASEAAAAFPLTLAGKIGINGKTGPFALSIDKARSKTTIDLPGLARADGVDAEGAWQLGSSGSVFRLQPGESRRFDEWILRRGYLDSLQVGRDHARCERRPSGDVIIVTEWLPELGWPVLVLDRKTAALLSAEHTSVVGGKSTTTYTWGPREGRAARWPVATESRGDGPVVHVAFDAPAPAAADAFAIPPARLVLSFPKGQPVKVPMKMYGSELLLHVKVGGKAAIALLDSGAGISIVEAHGNAAAQFQSVLDFEGQSATQALTFGLGTFADVSVGALAIKSLPGARVPIPAFDQFGVNRPDVVLGWSLFEGVGVRIDYAKSEVTFAPNADALHAQGASPVTVRDLEDKVVVDASLGENARLVRAPFEIDTGNAQGFSLYEGWANAHGFPGERASVSVVGQFSAGTDMTRSVFFRATTELGQIHADGDLIEVSESPDSGIIAGLVGNDTLSKCDAVTFDLANRKLWLEGRCERPTTSSHAWWTLLREDDSADKGHPWVIASVAPRGAADNAGIARGDRLLSIDARSAGLAYDFASTMRRPLGTKLAVVVKRANQKKAVVMTLADPL